MAPGDGPPALGAATAGALALVAALAGGCGDGGEGGGVLPCPSGEREVWVIEPGLEAMGRLRIVADTVAEETAFDPAFDVYLRALPPADTDEFEEDPGIFFELGDDEVECTFPPPAHACPTATGPVEGGEVFVVEVFHPEPPSCAGPEGEYELRATLGELEVPVVFVGAYDPTLPTLGGGDDEDDD